MDLRQLKQRIYEDNNIIPLLESLDCSHIKYEQSGSLIVAGLPDGFDSKNKRTIQIKNTETLTSYIRSRDISGDIFAIVGFILYNCNTFDETKENLYQIVQYICNVLNYEANEFQDEIKPKENKVDWLYFLRPVIEERKKELRLDELPINIPIDNNVMNQYIDMMHIDWYQQGLREKTRKEFQVMYDIKTERIVFPIHNINNEIIGVKGRYTGKEEDIPKYLFLYKCYKSIELFNLNRALEYINKQRQIIIMESEKATMLAWEWGIKNCVALMGGDLEPTQVYILKKLGIDLELVFMFDKDKSEEYVRKQIKQIKNRKIKIMVDKSNLLSMEDKNSPIDKGKNIFEKLIKENLITIQGGNN